VWFGPEAEQLNRTKILNKIDNVIEQWKDMNLSMQGKLLITNTKILSQFYHIVRITGMSRKLRDEIQKRLNTFIWYPKKMCMIAYRTLQNKTAYGGLDFPNLEDINNALLAERIAKIRRSNRQWSGHMIFRMGRIFKDLDPSYADVSLYTSTFTQTTVTRFITKTYRTLKHKVPDWSIESFKTLKDKLHENTELDRLKYRDFGNTWQAIQQLPGMCKNSKTKNSPGVYYTFTASENTQRKPDNLLRRDS